LNRINCAVKLLTINISQGNAATNLRGDGSFNLFSLQIMSEFNSEKYLLLVQFAEVIAKIKLVYFFDKEN